MVATDSRMETVPGIDDRPDPGHTDHDGRPDRRRRSSTTGQDTAAGRDNVTGDETRPAAAPIGVA